MFCRLLPTNEMGLMWTGGTTSRGTVTILESRAFLTLTELWNLCRLLSQKMVKHQKIDNGKFATGTRYAYNSV